MIQPKLFEKPPEAIDLDKVILYALGDFQSRKKVLAEREIALDRLRGAFLRAFAKYGLEERPDSEIAAGLKNLGAVVKEVPGFVAKHPYRVTVPSGTALKGIELFVNESPEPSVSN
jgi:hypothetical protein